MFEIKNNIILSLENISVSFSRSYKKDGKELTESKSVIENISIKLSEGEILALMGGNGSGKTTLFNVISGLLEHDSGKVIFKGKDITNLPPYKRAQLGIGRLFQDNHIFPNLSVLDNMCLSSSETFGELPFVSLIKNKQSKLIEEKRINTAKDILQNLMGVKDNKLLEKQNDLAGELSYGLKRLLGLARIFMGDHDLILLDEPTAGVDEKSIKNIRKMVEKLADEKVSIIIIDHDKEFIEKIADRVIYLKDKHILTEGTPSEVFKTTGFANAKD